MDGALYDWFVREILCHEAALTRYLGRARSNPADVQDLRHDIYVRVFEAAGKARPHSAKAFLFATARHLVTDLTRRSRIVSIDLMEDLDVLNVLVDETTPERRAGARQQLQRLSAAMNRLPDRCREVVWLQRVEGLPQKEIARRLGIAIGTVEKHILKGIRLLAGFYREDETPSGGVTGERSSEDETHHGK
jgi:RNA polymerase sigma-70 factor (ECF subfamily)